ncbi:outer membrane protein [Afifella pfennigii]|uniref:outer membrane protein n=1 Tax=Afifella pfennigii TaxID=209897 RepID=UPI00047CD129|nr:outer membrane beta-barrel protein [Afifella pfennigii]
MRGFGLVALGTMTLASQIAAAPALAADLPEYAEPPAPITTPAPVSEWEGFYRGLHFGWSADDLEGQSGGVPYSMSDDGGFAGGGLGGYNWLFGNVMLGLEGDVVIHETKTTNAAANIGTDFIWDAGAYARLGYVWGRFMPFVTAGARMAEIHAHTLAPTLIQGDVVRHYGWSLGAGLEVAVFYPFRLRAEYLYTNYSQETYRYAGTTTSVDPETHQLRGAIVFALGDGFEEYPQTFLTAPGNSWSGFYGGLSAGAAFLSDDTTLAGLGAGTADGTSLGGGMFLGASAEWGRLVGGIDMDLSLRGGEQSVTIAGTIIDKEPMWDAHVRARLGYDAGHFLPFVAGGFAITQVHFTQAGTTAINVEPARGWTIGGGVDVAVTDRIFARLEYLHDEYQDVANALPAGATSFEPSVDTVRAGIAVRLP